jgi:hypothetical protein
MTTPIILTVSYALILAGSIGMVLFATRFSFSTNLWEQPCTKERLFGLLNGREVWILSWVAIILGTLGQLVACWLPINTRHASVDVAVYPVMKQNRLPLNPSVYRVDSERQTVIYWTPGVDEAPSDLARCAVRDAENWRCRYPDGSAILEMKHGKYHTVPLVGPLVDDPDKQIEYVTEAEWRAARQGWRDPRP